MAGSNRAYRRVGRSLRAAVGRFHRDEGGQALFVVMVFFFLLAALLFLILNSGQMLNKKVEIQGAADSVAASGAAWYARGLNTVSMCNVVETQFLSMIVLLDTLETVTPPAQKCIDDLVQNIGQSKAGHDIPIDPRLQNMIVGNAGDEQEIINQFSEIVKAVQWPTYLNYDSGVLWQCAKLMDGLSHAMIAETPIVVQRESIDIAKQNHADFGLVVPLWPTLPVVDGQFGDFRNPMVTARMPPSWNNTPIHGFDRIMGYVGYRGQRMGPWSYWREPFVSTQPMGLFDLSRFSALFNVVAQMKLDMLFGGTNDQVSLSAWEMDYDKAKALSQSDPTKIKRVWWETMHFDARYTDNEENPPYPPPSNMSPWTALKNPTDPVPYQRNYPDMNNPNLAGYTRATESYQGADSREAVWYRVDRRRTPHYPQLDIIAPHPPTKPDGTAWPYTDAEMHTYWAVTVMRFDGAELTPDTTLHRNYLPPPGTEPFKPVLFDPATGDNYTDNINNSFTLTGFAYRTGKVADWAKMFVNPNPIPDTVAFAQARVYMPVELTWDTFTQHWRVKLMRTDKLHWDRAIEELNAAAPDGAENVAAELTPQKIQSILQVLQTYPGQMIDEVGH